METGRAAAPPSPHFAVPSVTAHPSTASVPITVLLYDGPLLCGFNVAIKGLSLSAKAGLYAMTLSICLSVCSFVRPSVCCLTRAAVPPMSGRIVAVPPLFHLFYSAMKNSPSEIYASGGGLLVASIIAPLLFQFIMPYPAESRLWV